MVENNGDILKVSEPDNFIKVEKNKEKKNKNNEEINGEKIEEKGEDVIFKPIETTINNDSSSKKNMYLNMRRIFVPPHRYTPLKNNWIDIIRPIVEHMKLQIRMNIKMKCIEVRIPPNKITNNGENKNNNNNSDINNNEMYIEKNMNNNIINMQGNLLEKTMDYLKAYMLGFELKDSIALLRLDDIFIESFEIKDVKRLVGGHISRCIGRISGKEGKTKYIIENTTHTRIVLADTKIHILGSFHNIKLARNAICSLILGSPPSKVYNHLKTVSKRIQEKL